MVPDGVDAVGTVPDGSTVEIVGPAIGVLKETVEEIGVGETLAVATSGETMLELADRTSEYTPTSKQVTGRDRASWPVVELKERKETAGLSDRDRPGVVVAAVSREVCVVVSVLTVAL